MLALDAHKTLRRSTVSRSRLDFQLLSDMPFLQHCCSDNSSPLSMRVQRAVKAWMHASLFEPCVPLAVKGGAPLSSTSKRKSHFPSTGAKRRSLIFPLRSSPHPLPSRSLGERSSNPKPADVEASNESPIILIDSSVAPPSSIYVPVLPLPVRDGV